MQKGGQNSDANDTALLWGPVVVVVLCLILWFFFKKQIVDSVFLVKSYEMSFIIYIIDPVTKFLNFLHLPSPNFVKLHMVRDLMRNPDVSTVDLGNFFDALNYAGLYFRFVTIIVLILLALVLFLFPSSSRFHKVYNMQNLRKLESQNWPQITPILSLDLVNEDVNTGPWAMALNPMDFCFKYNIVAEDEAKRSGNLTIAHGIANKVFVMQLGAPFTGIRNTPIYVRAIFVILAAAAAYDRDTMDKIIRQISASANTTGNLDFTGIDDLVAKLEKEKFIKWLNPRHAYLTTWLSSLLSLARNSGVVATSEFLWLKAVDRRLWYTLNSVGRNTPFCETAGIHAHWLAERKVGRALKTPMVKQAVLGLEIAMSEIAYTSEDSEWQNSVA